MSARKKTNTVETVFLSTVSAFVLALLLLVPGALFVYNRLLPVDAIPVLSAIAAGLALFLSTVIFVHNRKSAAMLAGMTLAGYLMLIFLTGVCACRGQIFGTGILWQSGAAFVGTMVGVMVASGKRTKRIKRARR